MQLPSGILKYLWSCSRLPVYRCPQSVNSPSFRGGELAAPDTASEWPSSRPFGDTHLTQEHRCSLLLRVHPAYHSSSSDLERGPPSELTGPTSRTGCFSTRTQRDIQSISRSYIRRQGDTASSTGDPLDVTAALARAIQRTSRAAAYPLQLRDFQLRLPRIGCATSSALLSFLPVFLLRSSSNLHRLEPGTVGNQQNLQLPLRWHLLLLAFPFSRGGFLTPLFGRESENVSKQAKERPTR